MRVYIIRHTKYEPEKFNNLSNEEFIDIAEFQGYVYTLEGYTKAVNNQDFNTELYCYYIRFIENGD